LGSLFGQGDAGNKHFKKPKDMTLLVWLANDVEDRTARAIDWIHMPVPIDRDDDPYFRPLEDLNCPRVGQLFLGLSHEQDEIDGTQRRMSAAVRCIASYGVATECGLGRRTPDAVSDLFELHAAV